jgi:tellurite resistance protein
MTSVTQSPYSSEQILAWLRGLLTIAWADGDFDPHEQELIASITEDEMVCPVNVPLQQPITAEELARELGKGTPAAGNFFRMAVMVAIADGVYSACEDHLLQKFGKVLGQPKNILEALRHTLYDQEQADPPVALTKRQLDALHPVRNWLDGLEIHDPALARFLCRMIPPQCPFERDITLFGRKIVHIPPMCKLNPLYDQLVGLRFRALSYLADERGEDVSQYC